MAFISKWKIFCIPEDKFYYVWDVDKPTSCPNSSEHSANALSINSIFRVYKYKSIDIYNSPAYLSGYNFYRCNSLFGDIIFDLTSNKKDYRYIIIQKLSNRNQVIIDEKFILHEDKETVKLYYNGTDWIKLDIDGYEGEVDRLLEPSFYNNYDDDELNFSVSIKTRDPVPSDDVSSGYYAGSRWLNKTSNVEFALFDNTKDNAVWVNINYNDVKSNFLDVVNTTTLELNFNALEDSILYFKDGTIKSSGKIQYKSDANKLVLDTEVDVKNNHIINLAYPNNGKDAANRDYVDDVVAAAIGTIVTNKWNICCIMPTGTNGGQPVLETWANVHLNYIDGPNSDVTLNTDIIKFVKGRYKVFIKASFHKTEGTAIRFYDMTNSIVIKKSNSYRIIEGTNVSLYLDIITNSDIECALQYYVTEGDNTGLGFPLGISGEEEQYVTILVERSVI